MTPKIFEFNNENDFVIKASSAIENFIEKNKSKNIRIALSGGSSPKKVYETLAKSQKIDWSKIAIYQVDERYVNGESNQSNQKLIKESLIKNLKTKVEFHYFNTKKTIEKSVLDYQNQLKTLKTPLFHLVLLGLGEDGHTASLFPKGNELKNKALALESIAPKEPKKRMSLGFSAIMNSEKIIFLIQGKKKEKIIQKWLNDNIHEKDIPAKTVLKHQNIEIYYNKSK